LENTNTLESEKELWEESPSHWSQFGMYTLSVILIAAFGAGLIMMLVIYLKIKYTRYKLTDQRLVIQTGVFSRSLESVELYRIKDIKYNAGFMQRMVGIGTVKMISSDRSMPVLELAGFRGATEKFNQLRSLVEACRMKRGVKEFDQNDRVI